MKTTYQSNQDTSLLKKKHYYKINSKYTKRKKSNESFSDSVHHHSKKHKRDGNLSLFEEENQNADDEGHLPKELDQSEMEKLVEKMREKLCFSTCFGGDKNRHRAHVCVICGCLVIGLEEVKYVDKQTLLKHSTQLCVSHYEEFHGIPS